MDDMSTVRSPLASLLVMDTNPQPTLKIMSWNVAAWATTCKLIVEHYGSVDAWLQRHGVDILCLQEVKYTQKTFDADIRATGARAQGWESAWSLSRPPSQRLGMDGVATFCRTGRMQAADAAALGSIALDCEGRCVYTDHGDFVLFNVYVPTSGRMLFKMQFLRALRRAMQQRRAEGRPVILAGDLNIKRRAEDIPWRSRTIDFRRAFSEPGAVPYDLSPALQAKLAALGPDVRRVLGSLRIVHVPGKSSGATGQYARKEDSFRVTYTKPPTNSVGSDAKVTLGRAYESEEGAMMDWQIGRNGADHVAEDPDNEKATILVWRGDNFAVSQLAEVVIKALGQSFPDAELRELAQHGTSYSAPCLLQWIDALTEEDGMVDTFSAVHPNAVDRFTCWEQYTNRRYENDGMRIDYIIVDACLAPRIVAGAPLPTGSYVGHPDAPEAALSACTAGGRWKPAPFEGGGMQDAAMVVYDSQFTPWCTGIRYMPPKYSDHTAVTLLLRDDQSDVGGLVMKNDTATRFACPQKAHRSLQEMWTSLPKGSKPTPPPPAAAQQPEQPAEEAGGSQAKKPRKGQQSLAAMFGAAPTKAKTSK